MTQALLTTSEVAEILRVRRGTLTHWRGNRRGPPFIRVGAAIPYSRGGIAELVKAADRADQSRPFAAEAVALPFGHSNARSREGQMQNLTLRRDLTGTRSAHTADGQMVGRFDLGDLGLSDDEFEYVVGKYAKSKEAAGAADQFVKQVRDLAQRIATGNYGPTRGGASAPESAEDHPPVKLEGRPAGNAQARRAHERARERGVSFHQALSELCADDPALAQFAREEATLQSEGMFAHRPNYEQLFNLVRAEAEARGITYREALEQVRLENPGLYDAAVKEGGLWIKDLQPLPGGGQMVICHGTELGDVRDPDGCLLSMARNRARANGIEYTAALSGIKRDYPKLAAAANRQVLCLGEFQR